MKTVADVNASMSMILETTSGGWAMAMALVEMPEKVNIQTPPNLAPVRNLLDCGMDDLGGVLPVSARSVLDVGPCDRIGSDADLNIRHRLIALSSGPV